MSDNAYVCRCEDVTIEEVQQLIQQGFTTVEEIKRLCRCGMGPCGGKTCTSILMNEIAKASGESISEVRPGKFRPPAKNIKLGALAKAGEDA